jgi:peptidoglycan/LPS O-acetylase OafA/YrhL
MVATFLVFAVLMPQAGIQSHWFKLVLDLCTFQYTSFDNLGAFNGLMWTLSTEVQFYFWMPFWFKGLSMALKYVAPVWLLIGLLVLGSLLRVTLYQQEILPLYKAGDLGLMFQTWAKLLYVPLSTNAYLFAGGMLLNWLIPSWLNYFKASRVLTGLLVVFPLMAYLLVSYLLPLSFSNFHLWAFKTFVLFLPLFAFLVVTPYLVWNELRLQVPVSLKSILAPAVSLFENLGKWSYGIYLWHGLFFWQFVKEWVHLKNFGGNIAFYWCGVVLACLVIASALAALTFRLIEQPFELRKHNAMPLEDKPVVVPLVVDTMKDKPLHASSS